MSRSKGGWTKRHRALRDHWIGRNVFANAIWDYLLDYANFKDGHTLVDGQRVLIKRGQIVTSAREIAAHYSISRKTVERWLDKLAGMGSVSQQVSHHGRIITICRYEEFQSNEDEGVPPSVPPEGLPQGLPLDHIVKKEEGRKKKQPHARTDARTGALKLEANGIVAKLLATQDLRSKAFADLFDGRHLAALTERFPNGVEQLMDHWSHRSKKSPPAVVQAQLRDDLAAFLGAQDARTEGSNTA